MKTWAVVGASRGIGREFVKQILSSKDAVLATMRDTAKSKSWPEAADDACKLFRCDMLSAQSINVRCSGHIASP